MDRCLGISGKSEARLFFLFKAGGKLLGTEEGTSVSTKVVGGRGEFALCSGSQWIVL